MEAAPAPAPLRRDPANGVIGGVCAGLAPRLGVDALVLRVVFVVVASAGGAGIGLYLLAWVFIPAAEGERRFPKIASGPGAWQVAAGIGLLVLAVLLLFRAWGLWVGDAVAWPVTLVATGGALVWRQSRAGAPPAEPRDRVGFSLAPAARGRAWLGAA